MQKARQVIQTKQSEVIGTVSITPMGAWNADLNYEKDNYVRHDGATYMSRQPNKGIEPGVSQDWEQYWMLSIKDGASATVEVGETTTLPAGEQATVTNSGSDTNVVLDFAIPQGEQGLTGTVTVGKTITGQPGTEAVVENAGDEHNAILNFTIPRGEPGEPGNDPNAVHFTQQDLTDVQQQQARQNIGAADAQTVEDILGGNEIVGKANADGAGNIISDTYATKAQLSTAIEAEQSAREQADDTLQTNIDNEASAREEADTTLQGNIASEATARENADTALGSRIDDVVDGTTIVSHATAADKLNTNAGGATNPVYFENGVPVATGGTLNKDISGTAAKATADASGNTITTFYGHSLTMTIDSTTYVVTLSLLDAGGTALSTQTIDLPLESVVVSGSYDADTKEVVLTLQGGTEVRFSVADLVDGLASQSALEAEAQARQQADTTLQNNINAEATARQQADTALGQRIDDLNATDIALSVPNISATNVADGFEELNENINQITGGGVVTGVKGNAETAFRTGQVNLTPANIGAATEEALQDVIDGTTPVAKAENADNATKATQDAQGNVINTTYARNDELGDKCVLYTEAQTLTEEQKAQARNNIGVDSGGGGNNIANATVTLGASLTFNGSAQTQTVASVKLGDVTLSAGTDYDISGNVATNAGNYTLIVSGKGDYTGFVFVDWSIAKAQGSISVPASVDIIGAVGTQKQVTVVIGNGYGDLVVSSSDPDTVVASTVGNVITLTSVAEGNATISITLVGNYQAQATISVMTALAYSTLADNTPATIRYIADNDLGANYWAVGDTYPVPLNGTVGTVQYDNLTVWAYILGFNHNPDREGEHLIHFGGFKTAQTDGVNICLDDSHYLSTSTSGAKWFNMNHSSNTNSGGWKGCDMRYDILGSTDTNNGEPTTACATDPVSGTLMAAFPADLRAVMRPATKYTDNTGRGGSSSSNVTATQDYMPLLAEFEVQGARSYANSAEQNYQTQYAYYANGNSKVKHRQTSPGSAAHWWCRSPDASDNHYFCYVGTDGSAHGYTAANLSLGVSPAFFI